MPFEANPRGFRLLAKADVNRDRPVQPRATLLAVVSGFQYEPRQETAFVLRKRDIARPCSVSLRRIASRRVQFAPSYTGSFARAAVLREDSVRLSGDQVQTVSVTMAQLIGVKLSRFDGSPWGFRLQGGKDFGTPLVVQKVSRILARRVL